MADMFSVGQKVVWNPGGVSIPAVVQSLHPPKEAVVKLANGDIKVAALTALKAEGVVVRALPASAVKVIDAFKDTYSRSNDGGSAALKSILRITRGPDQASGGGYKDVTTAVLRYLAFGDAGSAFGTIEKDPSKLTSVSRADLVRTHGEHFASNITQAAAVFGLSLRP